jgi:RNA polymerase sigma-70 factor (ECF subfamily)
MTDGQAVVVPGPSRQPQGTRAAEDVTDRQLLERFVTRRDGAAFAALVGRHGPRVLGVCRRVLRHEQDAEDVFQATFLVLARRAAVIPWQESVSRWLSAVAYRLALHARGGAARRRRRERPVRPARRGTPSADDGREPPAGPVGEWDSLSEKDHPCADPLAEVARRELRRVLDDELLRLPEKYRAPVVLCYLEGKTNEEAARELGWPTGSMSRRLARARALLRQRLTRRGLALATAVLSLVLTALWVSRVGPGPGPRARPTQVARVMSPFKPTREGGQGIESALLRLAREGEPEPGSDPGQLVRIVYQTAAAADFIKGHPPGARQREWQGLSDEMRRSALDLADALRAKEGNATLLAARRLTASCQKCHEIFRD